MDDTRDPSREVVNESNRSLVVGYGAIRPVINEYPKTASGKRTFSFQSRWYELYPWLEYSEKRTLSSVSIVDVLERLVSFY